MYLLTLQGHPSVTQRQQLHLTVKHESHTWFWMEGIVASSSVKHDAQTRVSVHIVILHKVPVFRQVLRLRLPWVGEMASKGKDHPTLPEAERFYVTQRRNVSKECFVRL